MADLPPSEKLRLAFKPASCARAALAGSISNAISAINGLRGLKAGTGLGAIGLAGQALDRLGGDAASNGISIKDLAR